MGKSRAAFGIVDFIRLKVITYDDLADFGADLQEAVKTILDR